MYVCPKNIFPGFLGDPLAPVSYAPGPPPAKSGPALQSHCKTSPGSRDEYAKQTTLTCLSRQSAYRQLTTFTVALEYYYSALLSLTADTYYTIPQRVEG